VCHLCQRSFKEFALPPEVWVRLPQRYVGRLLCEEDCLRLLRDAGHDTRSVVFDYTAWDKKCAEWEESKEFPPSYAHLLVESRELIWCEVLAFHGDGQYLVRLTDSTMFTRPLKRGVLLEARWNGSRRHALTGRAVLRPLADCHDDSLCAIPLMPGRVNGIIARVRSWPSVGHFQSVATTSKEFA
jgi:hypothetical protein